LGFKGELEDGTASLKSTDKGASKALRICRTRIPSSQWQCAECPKRKSAMARENGRDEIKSGVGHAEWLNKTVKHDMG